MAKQLVRFGVVADVQYADSDDRPAWYDPSKTRYYRNALNQVRKAYDQWIGSSGCSGSSDSQVLSTDQQMIDNYSNNFNKKIGFVLQLGDIIDGLNANSQEAHDSSLRAIRRTLNQFECHKTIPAFHTVGNHELYNFTRKELAELFRDSLFKKLKVDSDSIGLNELKLLPDRCSTGSTDSDDMLLYYKFYPQPGLKLISLDCFDISVLGHEPTHPKYQLAADILARYHGCRDMDVWDTETRLVGPDRRYQASNGAISREQIQWLDEELAESDSMGELVIVFGHVGLHPGSSDWNTVCWNYDEVVDCFNRHRSVVGYLSGHSHSSGYTLANGVHYITFHGIVETPPDTEAFASVSVYEDRLVIEGYGYEKSRVLPFSRLTSGSGGGGGNEIADEINVNNNNTNNNLIQQTIDDLANNMEDMSINTTVKVEV
ncbi:manganese-dependent ADP-ribose/CDP-alcohol diphosphatase-like [Oppia nitens]|uniref:manganese-dependent ADP-ribose/CDP-alcohol diphosphatase-like n=1 Tax=Oppia nitens TaxID=1686743 RepID=UPI0023DA9CCD|nr:manganese-dependent ADP-ribose/CDP-alcohol diphosphatase-like [Oppia nitens]